MIDYICRQDLLREIEENRQCFIGSPDEVIAHNEQCDYAYSCVSDAIAVDVAPIRHGRWVDNGVEGSMLSGCSVCGFPCGAYTFNYCPRCGSKMDFEVEG